MVDRAGPLDLVDRLTLRGVELVAVVRRLACLLEPDPQLLGGIDLGRLWARLAPEEPPERGQSEGPAQSCQQSAHAGDATLSVASCLVSRAPFPLTLAAEAA